MLRRAMLLSLCLLLLPLVGQAADLGFGACLTCPSTTPPPTAAGDLLLGNSTPIWTVKPAGADGTCFRMTSGLPEWTACPTGLAGAAANGAVYATGPTTATSTPGLVNGQLLVGRTGLSPVAAAIQGTTNQIAVTLGSGTITVSIPASPSLAGITTGTFSGALTGNASTASALDHNPAACGPTLFVTDQAADGTLGCTQPAFSDLTGAATAGQLPATAVTSVASETNLTGSISAQVLTLAWAGTLAKARMVASVVYTDQVNTFTGAGALTGLPSPTSTSDAATKGYVDGIAVGMSVRTSPRVATTAALTATYANGASGVGATLTNSGTLAALSLDGVALASTDRVLVKNQAATLQDGIYTVTTVGSGAVAWVLTRATDYDAPGEVTEGSYVVVTAGTVQSGTMWIMTQPGPIILGTTPIVFTALAVAPQTITLTGAVSGTGTGTIGTTLALVVPALGGTGAANTAISGRYLKGDGTNFVTSTGSASGVGPCTNQFARVLNADAAPTCASVSLGTDVTGTLLAANFPTLGGDVATSPGTLTTTLATVNSTVGTYANATITVNAKGLVTQAVAGSVGDVTDVGSCTGPACFTAGTPSASLVFSNATSGTVTLQTVPGALGTVVVSLPATTGTVALIAGNIATATALAANGGNCSPGSFPLGVDTLGAVESCTALPTAIGGTANQILVSAATGTVSISTPQNIDTAAAVRFGQLGLGMAAPGAPGQLAATGGANNLTLLTLKRNTDAAPTGIFVDLQTAAGSSLWTIDITGSLSVGTVPGARVSGNIGGQAGTALALAANPSPCPTGPQQFVTDIAADGTLTCATPAGSGNVSSLPTPTAGQLALWTSATVIQGMTALPAANVPHVVGDVDIPAGTLTATLATVNSTVGTYTNATITVNAKGLVTAAATGSTVAGDVTDVGSCTSGACFTVGGPSASLVFSNATSGTVTLQTVPGALGGAVVSLPAASGTVELVGGPKRVTTLASSTTFTCPQATSDQCDMAMTGAAGTLTVAAPTPSTPANGDSLLLGFLCTADQTFAWNAIFRAGPSGALPTTCAAGTTTWTQVGFRWSSVLSAWQQLGTNLGVAYNQRYVTAECISETTAVTTGDGKFYFPVHDDLNGWRVVGVSGRVGAAVSSSGAVTVALDRCAAVATGVHCSGTNVDVLSTNLTIDANKDRSEIAAVPAVVNAANAVLSPGQWLRVNVDGAGTGTQGLYVTLVLRQP